MVEDRVWSDGVMRSSNVYPQYLGHHLAMAENERETSNE